MCHYLPWRSVYENECDRNKNRKTKKIPKATCALFKKLNLFVSNNIDLIVKKENHFKGMFLEVNYVESYNNVDIVIICGAEEN